MADHAQTSSVDRLVDLTARARVRAMAINDALTGYLVTCSSDSHRAEQELGDALRNFGALADYVRQICAPAAPVVMLHPPPAPTDFEKPATPTPGNQVNATPHVGCDP